MEILVFLVRPLGLRLEGENRPFSADRRYEHTCISWGARPPALITWWKGSTRLQSSRQAVSSITSKLLLKFHCDSNENPLKGIGGWKSDEQRLDVRTDGGRRWQNPELSSGTFFTAQSDGTRMEIGRTM